MSEYILTLITVSAVISVALALTYKESEKSGLRCAFAVILLYVTLVPIINGARNFDVGELEIYADELDFEENFELSDFTGAAFARGVALFVAEEFELDAKEVRAEASGFDPEAARAEKITLTLVGRAALADTRAIRETVEKNGLGACEVKIEIK